MQQILGNKLPDWTNHDIRRTVRTKLSALRIPEEVREAVLAHARPGIKGHYDHHQYLDEKRDALSSGPPSCGILSNRRSLSSSN